MVGGHHSSLCPKVTIFERSQRDYLWLETSCIFISHVSNDAKCIKYLIFLKGELISHVSADAEASRFFFLERGSSLGAVTRFSARDWLKMTHLHHV